MPKTAFGTYLENYYFDWQKKYGRASIRKFAKWLDINQSLVTQWMNGKGPKPGLINSIKLGSKLGPEIYNILEMDDPAVISISHLPPSVRDRLEEAIYESNSELASHGLSSDSPEAEEIVIKIFEKHRFKYTRTTRS